METLQKKDNEIREKVKAFLKEKKWDTYTDTETKIKASITRQKKEVIDKKQLDLILSRSQIAQVMHIKTFENLLISTEKERTRLSNYVMGNKGNRIF